MAWLSRLKDSNYYINFDEGCVYCGNTIVAEINSSTHMEILTYLSNNPRLWLSSDSIIDNCWSDHYTALNTFYSTISKLRGIHPEIAKSIESKKGMGYRYLGQKRECCNVESVQKEQSAPALPISTNAESLAYDALMSEIERLSHQMYSLVDSLEEIQRKISIATNSKNLIWEGIYETQFKTAYFQFNHLQVELLEKQNQLEKVKQLTQRCGTATTHYDHSSNIIACRPAADIVLLQDVRNMESEVSELFRNIAALSNEMDTILEYLEFVSKATIIPMTFSQLIKVCVPGCETKYDAKAIARALQKNDYSLYPELAQNPELAGDYEGTWAKYLQKNQESFKYLVDDCNNIVGNFSFLALTQPQIELVLQGLLLENTFDIGKTASLSTAGIKEAMYILNYSINHEYATLATKNKLKELFFDTLLEYAEYDIYFKRIIINIFDPSQEPDFEEWGFIRQKNRPGVNYGTLFILDLIPYPDALNSALSHNKILRERNKKLKEIYDAI